MSKDSKLNLILYWLVSTVTFIYLITPRCAAISVLVFILVQFVMLWFLVPKRKVLWMFLPIFLLSLNSFISLNGMWQIWNFIAIVILYNAMVVAHIGNVGWGMGFISRVFENVLNPFYYMPMPFTMFKESRIKGAQETLKVLTSILIAVPVLILLLLLLSSADAVFASKIQEFLTWLANLVNIENVLRLAWGISAGLYMFGLGYIMLAPEKTKFSEFSGLKCQWDLLIINVLLTLVLLVYTAFVVVQFTHLFAGIGALPAGVTYSEYARQGFFQLLFLSIANIVLIFAIKKFTDNASGGWNKFKVVLLAYSCLVTAVLLVSSFYRLWMYIDSFGMSRLRFLVSWFLAFTALGLIATTWYIFRSKFNVIGAYVIIVLAFYIFVNLVPMDAIIARHHVDRFLNGQRSDLIYVAELSDDVRLQLRRLMDSDMVDYLNEFEKQAIERKLDIGAYRLAPFCWQRFNLQHKF